MRDLSSAVNSYLSEVDTQIKVNGAFECYTDAMTEESYMLLIHNNYSVKQFTDHFSVTKKEDIIKGNCITIPDVIKANF